MNKLCGAMIYLCGPIDRAKGYGSGWRQKITPILQGMGIKVLDPTNKPTKEFSETSDDQVRRHQLKVDGKFQELHDEGQRIRWFDLRCVDKADAVIVYLDTSITMCGTIEELDMANRQKKPCLIFCEQGKVAIPNWIYWMIHPNYIYNNIDEIVKYLRDIDAGAETDNRRWRLFDDNFFKGLL